MEQDLPDSGLVSVAQTDDTDRRSEVRDAAVERMLQRTEPSCDDAELLALQSKWDACAAAYTRAIEEQGTISDNAPGVEAPPPREPIAEWARLIPGWRQRTGIEAAETATAEAMDDLSEVENRISNMPARTLAGLQLKARVAQRNGEVSWPEGLEESLVQDILAIGELEIEADAELLQLSRQFETARAREKAVCDACNAAQREADRHMPERPACLTYRASDEPLRVYQYLTDPEGLNGVEIGSTDVERLRRIMPMTHEVLRPIRPGERSHRDHPGRKFDIVPHPEAQARAEEIVTGWDAWRAEQARIQDEHVTTELEDAAEAAGEAAGNLAEQIARLPARTAAGFQVKLRAFAHYRPKALLAELPELPDPDQILSHSLWQDMQGSASTVEGTHPVTVEEAATLDFAAYTFDTPTRDPNGWMKEFAHHAIGMHVADRTLRMSKPELVAFIRKGGERDADVPATMLAALENAQRTFEGWGKLLDLARTRYLVAGSSAVLGNEGAVAEPAEPEALPGPPLVSDQPAAFSLVGMLDLASATMLELYAVRDIAERVGSVAYVHAWTPAAATAWIPTALLISTPPAGWCSGWVTP
ncbi:hypothetical protein [Methylobacterium sp. E-046]|uniref:hypothetical protein n=1 Tax=Methylobacterium sp. E-046 TaxID=2836576 RepID=UPI001FBBC6B0|nr:hypothetical protein [Methylobacterium sp. E-046]MCJ2098969.1 hypothetical protein [Methylobacterium sp. E-046]